MSAQPKHFYEFGPFRADPLKRILLRDGALVPLKPKVFEMLLVLVEARGQVLEKDELLRRVWPDSIVEESNLNVYVSLLRKALGESPNDRHYIVTISGRGYSFVADVQEIQGERAELIVQQRARSSLTIEEESETDAQEEVQDQAWMDSSFRQNEIVDLQSSRHGLAFEADRKRSILPDARNEQAVVETVREPAGGTEKEKAARTTASARHYLRRALPALTALVLSGGSLAYFVLRSALPPNVADPTQITRDGLPKGPNLFIDGSRLYFCSGGDIAQVSVTGGETVVNHAPPFRALDLSPNRSEFLVLSPIRAALEGRLWVLPVMSDVPRRVGDVMCHDATWSLDGQQIVYAYGSALYLAKSDGTESRMLVTVSGRPYWPRWSPDGSRLRFTVRDDEKDGSNSLWEVSADGSNSHPLLPGWNKPANECCGNWTMDGRYFVFQSTRNEATNIWVRREQAGLFRRASQEPVQLTVGPMNYRSPVPSQDGKRLFVVGELRRGELARYDTKTNQWDSYLSGRSAQQLDFSRDGAWVVYVTYPEGNLWRSKMDGSQRLQLTFPPMQAGLPRWSPDGKEIAFTARVPGKRWKTYLISAEGGTPQQLMPEERNELDPSWSPDGKTLVFGDYDAKTIRLFDLSTRQVSRLPGSEGLCSPRWSPDGHYIAALPIGSFHKLLLFDFTTQKWTELVPQTAFWPRWSRDGKYIYFHGQRPDDLLRVRIGDRKIDRIATEKNFRGAVDMFAGTWSGWAPDDSPLVLRDFGTQEIYALEWQTP